MNPPALLALSLTLLALVDVRAQAPAGPAGKIDAAAEIEAARVPYTAALEKTAAEREKWIASVETWYGTNLEKLQTARSAAGDLDGAVLVKAERDRVAAHAETPPGEVSVMPPALRTLGRLTRLPWRRSRMKCRGGICRRAGSIWPIWRRCKSASRSRATSSRRWP